MPTATLGIPTLRDALSRVKRLGAEVSNVHATGEVRVVHGDTRLTINARRKDATRELANLIATLEKTQPERANGQLPLPVLRALSIEDREEAQPIVRPVVTNADRIREHIRQSTEPRDRGWRPFTSADVAERLGVTSTQVAVWANGAERSGEIQLLRKGGVGTAYTALRFTAEAEPEPEPEEKPQEPVSEEDETEETPRPRPVPLGPTTEPVGVLPTPTLASYAEALKLSKSHDLLTITLTDEQQEKINAEAARLYWWVRAGGGPR